MDRLLIAAQKNTKVKNWADLARLLSESDQVLTNWKKRGIPKEKLMAVAELVRANPYWVRDGGEHPMEFIYAMDQDLQTLLKVAQHLDHKYRGSLIQVGLAFNESTDENGTEPKK